ncbi:MAG: molybdenum cofactor guanylyltransferase [Phycisphaerae bacterium]
MHDAKMLPPTYILAGGRSRRFGSDKARALVEGVSLLVRLTEQLKGLTPRVTIIADTPDKYTDLGLQVIVDTVPNQGPIGGLLTALEHEPNLGWILLMSCDLLDLPRTELQALMPLCTPNVHAVAYRSDTGWQPLPAFYHTNLIPLIREHIAAGRRALWQVLETTATAAAPCPPAWIEGMGANTPAELRQFVERRQRKSPASEA